MVVNLNRCKVWCRHSEGLISLCAEACLLTRDENEWYREPISANATSGKEGLQASVADWLSQVLYQFLWLYRYRIWSTPRHGRKEHYGIGEDCSQDNLVLKWTIFIIATIDLSNSQTNGPRRNLSRRCIRIKWTRGNDFLREFLTIQAHVVSKQLYK